MSDKTRKGENFSMKPLPPDDPIFSRGYIIGSIRQTGIVRRTYGAYHDKSDTATIAFGYRREPSDD